MIQFLYSSEITKNIRSSTNFGILPITHLQQSSLTKQRITQKDIFLRIPKNFNPFGANTTKWSNTLKKFVGISQQIV